MPRMLDCILELSKGDLSTPQWKQSSLTSSRSGAGTKAGDADRPCHGTGEPKTLPGELGALAAFASSGLFSLLS